MNSTSIDKKIALPKSKLTNAEIKSRHRSKFIKVRAVERYNAMLRYNNTVCASRLCSECRHKYVCAWVRFLCYTWTCIMTASPDDFSPRAIACRTRLLRTVIHVAIVENSISCPARGLSYCGKSMAQRDVTFSARVAHTKPRTGRTNRAPSPSSPPPPPSSFVKLRFHMTSIWPQMSRHLRL